MYQKDKWPFYPDSLGEIVDKETLAVLESGCCERIKRPLTIFDIHFGKKDDFHRIDSIDENQRYESFCQHYRDESIFKHGD